MYLCEIDRGALKCDLGGVKVAKSKWNIVYFLVGATTNSVGTRAIAAKATSIIKGLLQEYIFFSYISCLL